MSVRPRLHPRWAEACGPDTRKRPRTTNDPAAVAAPSKTRRSRQRRRRRRRADDADAVSAVEKAVEVLTKSIDRAAVEPPTVDVQADIVPSSSSSSLNDTDPMLTSVGFDVAHAVHTNFVDTLLGGKLSSSSGRAFCPVEEVPARPRDHALYRAIMAMHVAPSTEPSSDTVVRRPILEQVQRAHEEAYMRPPATGETACARGTACEGILVAKAQGLVSRGFTCVAFRLPSGAPCGDGTLCVLCLRKEVSTCFYLAKARATTCDVVMQPYRNQIGVAGEYCGAACIYPGQRVFQGVTDPFVRHERHRYSYVDDPPRIVHGASYAYRDDGTPPPPPPPLFRHAPLDRPGQGGAT